MNSTVPFGFQFYGRTETAAFVNSDGNITFDEPDKSSTERNVARLLTGPPRVSPFLADLDPSAGAGRVFLDAAADRYTVTWCNVRGFDTEQTTTVQATLLPSGTIEMVYASGITLRDAIVGLSPGRTGDFRTVNLTDPGPSAGGPAQSASGSRQIHSSTSSRWRRSSTAPIPTITTSSCCGPTRRSSPTHSRTRPR